MSRILVVDDDPLMHELIDGALVDEGYVISHAGCGEEGLTRLAGGEFFDLVLCDYVMPGMDGAEFLSHVRDRNPQQKCMLITAHGTPEAVIGALKQQVTDFFIKPFLAGEFRAAVRTALETSPIPPIEIVSAKPDWIELQVPCVTAAVQPLQKLLMQLQADLPQDTREAIAYAFREMLNNAIEHGGKSDPGRFVTVSYVRLQKAILYCIKDPGEGFDPAQLTHAAISNPDDNPAQHIQIREEKGMRAGGFGILLVRQMVDELVYNQKRNEVVFIKYLERSDVRCQRSVKDSAFIEYQRTVSETSPLI
ncbi:MAG: response regulator [Blastocatellia bacterium]